MFEVLKQVCDIGIVPVVKIDRAANTDVTSGNVI